PSPILRYILTMTTHMNNHMTGSHAALTSLRDQPTVTASSSASLAVNSAVDRDCAGRCCRGVFFSGAGTFFP
ncbi:MAG: hypothetical protein Q8P38_05360, partial [Candidatus Nanopelagicales bacterium]|nr:hypothetical protein [Candidatus Nanopelagicales bacterium]